MARVPRTRRITARCDGCRAPITWFRYRDHWRKYEPTPVAGRTHNGPPAHPVEGRRAWRPTDLTEELAIRRHTSHDDAREEVYDMPWHVPHACPPGEPQ